MRILYFSDIPIRRNSFGGPVVLHRLLSSLPASELQVISTNMFDLAPGEEEIPANIWHYPLIRLIRTRLSGWYNLLMLALSPMLFRRLGRNIRLLKPDLIVTVSHGYAYFAAAFWARRMKVPYVIIHHDVYATTFVKPAFAKNWINGRFAEAYQGAACNFCVSPYLTAYYSGLFNGRAITLFPGREDRSVAPHRLNKLPTEGLTLGYFGSINSEELLDDFVALANMISAGGHRIHLVGPVTDNQLNRRGLRVQNIICHPRMAQADLEKFVSENIDALLIVQESHAIFREHVSVNFPSKLVEYTRFQLPVIVFAPGYASASKFAAEYPEALIAISSPAEDQEVWSVMTYLLDSELRQRLGQRVGELGERLFDSSVVRDVFLTGIKRS
ncbi:MAG TPA: hypothetical protein DDZ56_12980 [Cytophagales bacterium]|nr:hypothetical protein [Cytophagales bacterium]